MKRQKLSVQELNALMYEVQKRVNKVNSIKYDKELSKNKEYIDLKKKYVERKKLQSKVNEMTNEIQCDTSNFRQNFGMNINYGLNGEIVISKNNNDVNIYNEIILMNLDTKISVEELINKLTDKLTK
jgi:hypothetical protein